jgi:REP element-mobilizing transposase RayT
LVYYKRNLPHFLPEGYAFFVTIRLANTIPKNVYEEIKAKYNLELKRIMGYDNNEKKNEEYKNLRNSVFQRYESILDKADFGRDWLRNEKIATILENSFFYNNKKKYDLIAFTIMPNHSHLIIKPYTDQQETLAKRKSERYTLAKIVGNIKSFTANKANEVLKRNGNFWHHESYDHVVRDEKELRSYTKYILNNPVKARLCDSSEEWRWNYYNPDYYL